MSQAEEKKPDPSSSEATLQPWMTAAPETTTQPPTPTGNRDTYLQILRDYRVLSGT